MVMFTYLYKMKALFLSDD